MKKKLDFVFQAKLEFKGSLKEFDQLQAGLTKLGSNGLMIDTVPLPEDKNRGLMIDSVPLPESVVGGLMIGTWPTPERKGSTVMIGTVPLPDRPRLPGIPVGVKLLGKDLFDKLAKGMPRFKLIKDINGGIRNPHLHLKDEVILFSKDRFREVVGQIASKLGNELVESKDLNNM